MPSCVPPALLHARGSLALMLTLQQGYGNSQGGGVWRGGNKQQGFDSESLG
jgi:hypothetical protein